MAEFWGIHDAEALAAVRRKIGEFFPPLPDLAAWVGRLNLRIPIRKLARSVHRPGILARGLNSESQRSLSGDGQRPISECVPRGGLADWYSDLLHEDEEGSRPKRSAMNLAG
jgi:hypothetical protein